jgi:hypothetical protein
MSVMTSGIVIQMQASLHKLANNPQNWEWMNKYIDQCILLEETIEDLQRYRREGFTFITVDLYGDRLRGYLLQWKETIESATDPLGENELWKTVTLSYLKYLEKATLELKSEKFLTNYQTMVALEYFKCQIRENRFLMKSAIKWASITPQEFLQAEGGRLDIHNA